MPVNAKGVLWIGGGALVLLGIGASLFLDDAPPPSPPPPPPMLATGPASAPGFQTSVPAPSPSVPAPAPAPPPASEPGRLQVVPDAVHFEAVVGGAARATVRVTNTGGSRLALTVGLNGDGAYAIDGGCPEALDPAQSCLLGLVYRPAAGGAAAGQLLVQPATGDPLAVPLEGLATPPAPPPAVSAPPDTSLRDRMREQRIAGVPQLGPAPARDAPRAAQEAYETRQQRFRTVNTAPEPAVSQPTYAGYPSYTSSLPVDSCRVVGADSVIEAHLLTYIDASQCGEVRAVVDRHVYNSGGNGSCRTVLIPAGSSLIGECTAVGGSQERVDLRWRRIIRAGDRAHILIEEAASDALGRKGLPGHVDRGTDRALLATVLGAAVNAATGGLIGALDRSTITSAIDITTGLATSTQSNRSAAGEAAVAFGRSMADGVNELVGRELERLRAQNQVVVPPGTKVLIIPTTDLWIRSPEEGPLVMGETGRGGVGERLNPQFQPAAQPTGGQRMPPPPSYAPSAYPPSAGGAYGAASGYEASRGGVVQQTNGALQPGQTSPLGSPHSGVAVQRVAPGRTW
ncbi:type IV secretory pathway VirB10-like protein [Azospirillum sp. OGB3]|uniref:TrbI/VirB10 family protein n=1 Tax=Azospirillum sp. OGB3 TaxID=2587012 RepID=UPI0016056DC8|nr:TrbI/VirB10 family protein [Azospirillum sp. OGB3]MBB3268389.1 type IV secretory pathway VirB10-like protein [Azospirillum sp. OGB3]